MQQVVIGALVVPTTAVFDLLRGEAIVIADPHDVAGLWTCVGEHVTHVLLLGEQRHEDLVRRHAVLLSDRGVAVSWLALPHGPAAVVVLAVEAASSGLDAGLLPAFVEALAARTWSGGWTPAVSHLVDPAPSVAQHLRSWLPNGNGFVVTLSGERGVVPVGSRSEPVTADESRGELYCSAPGIPEQARSLLRAVSGACDLTEVPALRFDPEERFGSDKAVELVALPTADRAPLPDVDRLSRCSVCAAAVPGEFCAYCHVRLARSAATTRGVRS